MSRSEMFYAQRIDGNFNLQSNIESRTRYIYAPMAGKSIEGLIEALKKEFFSEEVEREYYNDGMCCKVELRYDDDVNMFFVIAPLRIATK